MHLRLGYELLSQMGEKVFLCITAALLARAIVMQDENAMPKLASSLR